MSKTLEEIAAADVAGLRRAQTQYGDSWLQRGGVGAYMVMIRKADRMEVRCKRHGYDIFKALDAESYRDGLIDDIRDLRRYLMLIEAEWLQRSAPRKVVVWDEETNDFAVREDRTGQDHPFGYQSDAAG